jgi:hypothetical protein
MQVKGHATRKGLPFVVVKRVNANPHPAIKAVHEEPATPQEKQPEEVFDQNPLPLVLCDNNGCRFAVKWDRHTGRHLFCNKVSVPNRSFCEKHYSIVYEKRK